MKKFIPILILVFAFALISKAQDINRNTGWKQDIDTLIKKISTEHYLFRKKTLPPGLLTAAEKLKQNAERYSDERMLGELEKLMVMLGDGHSYILPISQKFPTYYLPLQFYLFSDGLFVIDADSNHTGLIGSRVVRYNGVPVNKMIAELNQYVHHDNSYTIKWLASTVLRFRGYHEQYGLKKKSAQILLAIERNGKKEIKPVDFVPASDFRGVPKLIPSKITTTAAPWYLSRVGDYYWFQPINDTTLYFQFNQVADKEEENIASFSRRLATELSSRKITKLIIDVRHNNGGNEGLLSPLLTVIRQFDRQSGSRLFVLTGRNTFSAAQILISVLNRDTKALFAGEPSSSKPNFVGEENPVLLPNSGAMGSISNKYHETIAGDRRKWIDVKYPVPLSSKDYFSNTDMVLEFVIRLK